MAKSNPTETAKRFLKYSFEDIKFEYSQLTDVEKSLCSEEEYKELVSWVKEEIS